MVPYAVTEYFAAISLCWSTLTFVNVIPPGLESCCESVSNMGATALHGPHQSAQTILKVSSHAS